MVPNQALYQLSYAPRPVGTFPEGIITLGAPFISGRLGGMLRDVSDNVKMVLMIIALFVVVVVGGLKLIGYGTKRMVDGKILTGQENP